MFQWQWLSSIIHHKIWHDCVLRNSGTVFFLSLQIYWIRVDRLYFCWKLPNFSYSITFQRNKIRFGNNKPRIFYNSFLSLKCSIYLSEYLTCLLFLHNNIQGFYANIVLLLLSEIKFLNSLYKIMKLYNYWNYITKIVRLCV